MDQPTKNFRTCAVASKLVSQAELDKAIASFWTKPDGAGAAQVQVSDQELAEKLMMPLDLASIGSWSFAHGA